LLILPGKRGLNLVVWVRLELMKALFKVYFGVFILLIQPPDLPLLRKSMSGKNSLDLRYFNAPLSDPESNALDFWKANHYNYPIRVCNGQGLFNCSGIKCVGGESIFFWN
jgi:hypothetical protein